MGFFSKLLAQDDWKKTLIRDLALLAAIDGEMDEVEIIDLQKISIELGFTEQKFVTLLQNLGEVKDIYPTDSQDKMDYLTYLLRLTYADGFIDDNEVALMKIIAQRMNLPADGIDDAIAIVESKLSE